MRKIILWTFVLVLMFVSALLLATGAIGGPQVDVTKKGWFIGLEKLGLAGMVMGLAAVLTFILPFTLQFDGTFFRRGRRLDRSAWAEITGTEHLEPGAGSAETDHRTQDRTATSAQPDAA